VDTLSQPGFKKELTALGGHATTLTGQPISLP